MNPLAPWALFVLAAVVLIVQIRMVWTARTHGAPRRSLAAPTGAAFVVAVWLGAAGLLAYAGPPQ